MSLRKADTDFLRGPTRSDAAQRLGITTRALHWATAALVACGFGAAWLFNALGPGPSAAKLVEVHRSIGLCILLVTVARAIWRATHPLPHVPSALWERWLAATVQAMLYIALLAMPVLGWLGSNAQGDTVAFLGVVQLPDLVEANQVLGDRLFVLHGWLGYGILALLTLHIAGALRHRFIKKDGVLQRMTTGRPVGPTSDARTR
ncbi:cytochrome b [Lichenifustis flavocetrariae]|uniref:Cytochrome b n=1 Tax=Lichenifustis flavocetrariae TaxID=2949735 RepID=A0AA41Z3A3_9HYPH|nr:cytochrome b [Lichenifustis flavocetrariae]MCW6512939.1 cytochrome b [Lichenifustis flavocetrariae]